MKKLHLILADAALALLDAFSLQSKVVVQGATARPRPLPLVAGPEISMCCLERKVIGREKIKTVKIQNNFQYNHSFSPQTYLLAPDAIALCSAGASPCSLTFSMRALEKNTGRNMKLSKKSKICEK